MNIKATREEINECLTRAIERVLRENIELVGTDDETDDDIELPEEEPDDNADVVVDDDYSYHDENFGTANPDDYDTANSELGDDEDDEDSYLNGEKPIEDNLDDVDTVDFVTDIDPSETDLINKLEDMFGPSTKDVHTGTVMFTIPADKSEEFKDACNDNDVEITDSVLQESVMPCEAFKVSTNGKVYWLRESKAVENVDTYKFRVDEGYRRQCWNNYKNGKYVM